MFKKSKNPHNCGLLTIFEKNKKIKKSRLIIDIRRLKWYYTVDKMY